MGRGIHLHPLPYPLLGGRKEDEMEYKPYDEVKVRGKTYWDYSIKIKGVVYALSVCEETGKLWIDKDEWQEKEGGE